MHDLTKQTDCISIKPYLHASQFLVWFSYLVSLHYFYRSFSRFHRLQRSCPSRTCRPPPIHSNTSIKGISRSEVGLEATPLTQAAHTALQAHFVGMKTCMPPNHRPENALDMHCAIALSAGLSEASSSLSACFSPNRERAMREGPRVQKPVTS